MRLESGVAPCSIGGWLRELFDGYLARTPGRRALTRSWLARVCRHRRLDHGAQHVRADQRTVARPYVEGLVGR